MWLESSTASFGFANAVYKREICKKRRLLLCLGLWGVRLWRRFWPYIPSKACCTRHSNEDLSATVRLVTCVRISALPLEPVKQKTVGYQPSCFLRSHFHGANVFSWNIWSESSATSFGLSNAVYERAFGENGSFKIAIVDVSEYAQWFFIV